MFSWLLTECGRCPTTTTTAKCCWMSTGKLTVVSLGAQQRERETLPFRHPLSENGLMVTHDPNVTTIYDNFQRSVRLYGNSNEFSVSFLMCVDLVGDKEFLGVRKVDERSGQAGPYQFETYAQVAQRIVTIAAALRSSLNIEERACVGLYSVNRPEWVIAEHACYANNFVTVPLYDTLGEESIIHICSQTDLEVVFASADKVWCKTNVGIFKCFRCVDWNFAPFKGAGCELGHYYLDG